MRAMTSWRFHLAGIALVDERKRLRQLAEEEQGAQRLKIIEQQTARVVARWRNGTMVRILNAWRSDAAEAKRHRNLLARFVGLMRNRTAARLMGRWADFVNERKRARAVVARALRRMQASGVCLNYYRISNLVLWSGEVLLITVRGIPAICANAPDLRRIWQNVVIDSLMSGGMVNSGYADGESAAMKTK